MDDDTAMAAALDEAAAAIEHGDVPIGAVVVVDGAIASRTILAAVGGALVGSGTGEAARTATRVGGALVQKHRVRGGAHRQARRPDRAAGTLCVDSAHTIARQVRRRLAL